MAYVSLILMSYVHTDLYLDVFSLVYGFVFIFKILVLMSYVHTDFYLDVYLLVCGFVFMFEVCIDLFN